MVTQPDRFVLHIRALPGDALNRSATDRLKGALKVLRRQFLLACISAELEPVGGLTKKPTKGLIQ